MTYQATARGEWPVGLYWDPGEIREVPPSWPGADSEPPEWLKPLKKTKKKTKKDGA